MKSKFEALKAFMSWPREWQELCAEFWAENEEPDQQRFKVINLDVAKTPTTIRNSFECIDQGEMKLGALPAIGDPFPYDRTRAVQRQREAAKTKRKRIEYTAQESDCLSLLIRSGLGPSGAMRSFCKLFDSGHTQESLKTKYYKRKQELRKSGEIK